MSDPLSPDTVVAARLRGRWGTALHGEPEPAASALRELAGSYWYCVYAWWRRGGYAEAGASTMACFTRWLTEAPPTAEEAGAGRFREWVRARLAEMPEGGVELEGEPALEIAEAWAEARYAQEPEGSADNVFQRRWALTVLEFTMESLRAEYVARGQEALFAEVLPFAGFADGDDEGYPEAGQRLGCTVGAVRKAVYDFRSRHREILRAMVSDTVADPEETDSELTALLCACGFAETPEASAPLPTAIRSLKPDELFARAMRSVHITTGAGGLWTPPSDAEVARLFPQYEMLGILGRGGMGAVYKARQIALDRCVAIKLLPLEVSVDRDFADRFVREARAMAKLSHPHIIAVHDFGTTSEGHLYFVMEFIEGQNLSALVHGPGLAPEQALGVIEQVCQALAYAHGKGVVHRDIKPANVMIDLEGQAKVADFGLARLTNAGSEQTGLTMSGTVMGTPDYMAPEQSRGMDVDHRADIYSLGVMLYEMLCREIPKGIFEPPSLRVGCDARIDQIVVRAMQQTPERRYQSTEEMRVAVAAASAPITQIVHPRAVGQQALMVRPRAAGQALGPRRPPPSRWRVYAGTAAVLLGMVGGFLYFSRAKPPRAESAPPVVTEATATKEAPFVNSLGMKFVPVPITGGPTSGQRVLFSIWETRVQDYALFATATMRDWPSPAFVQGPNHPAINVSWNDAQAFCAWLTERERASGKIRSTEFYRLPTDHEWSCAVGLGEREDPDRPPRSKKSSLPDVFPWGAEWPPPRGAANIADESGHRGRPTLDKYLSGYDDGFIWTSPVGSFLQAPSGLYDLSGNAWEWCEDFYEDESQRTLRGGSHDYFSRDQLWSCYRGSNAPVSRTMVYGFRVVLSERPPAPFTEPALPARPVPATVEFRGHRYLFVYERGVTWAAAKKRAEEIGGHLATLTDAAENDFVARYTWPFLPGTNNMAWLGAVRTGTEREAFQWVTGEPFQFAAWGEGNPSSSVKGDWLTLMHFSQSGGMMAWNDYEVRAPVENLAFYLRGFVVEWDGAPPAAPKPN